MLPQLLLLTVSPSVEQVYSACVITEDRAANCEEDYDQYIEGAQSRWGRSDIDRLGAQRVGSGHRAIGVFDLHGDVIRSGRLPKNPLATSPTRAHAQRGRKIDWPFFRNGRKTLGCLILVENNLGRAEIVDYPHLTTDFGDARTGSLEVEKDVLDLSCKVGSQSSSGGRNDFLTLGDGAVGKEEQVDVHRAVVSEDVLSIGRKRPIDIEGKGLSRRGASRIRIDQEGRSHEKEDGGNGYHGPSRLAPQSAFISSPVTGERISPIPREGNRATPPSHAKSAVALNHYRVRCESWTRSTT